MVRLVVCDAVSDFGIVSIPTVTMQKKFDGTLALDKIYSWNKPALKGETLVVFHASASHSFIRGFVVTCESRTDAEFLIKRIGADGYCDLTSVEFFSRVHPILSSDLVELDFSDFAGSDCK